MGSRVSERPDCLMPPYRPTAGRKDFLGTPKAACEARHFVERLLHEHIDAALLELLLMVVSELVTNAYRHSRSRNQGTIIVYVVVKARSVEVAVTDDGSDSSPRIPEQDSDDIADEDLAEGGRGLWTVALLSGDRWGFFPKGSCAERVVWAELVAPDPT